MTKGRVLSTLMLVAVLGTFGAVYQFYFKEKLENYSRDQELLASLETAYKTLSTTFSGYRPDVLTTAWRDQRIPWEDAVTDRATFFTDGGWYEHVRPPENVPILRFWYGEEANKLVNDVYQRLVTTLGYNQFPYDLYGTLGVPRMEEYAGYNVRRPEVNKALGRLAYGISAIELLLDAKATRIEEVVLWPIQEKPEHSGLLISRTVGLSFWMSMENLVKLLEKLRTSERYFSVDALQMDYPYIAYPNEPQVQVKLLLTQANSKPKPQAAPGAVPGAAGTPGVAGASTPQDLFKAQGFDRGRSTVKVEKPTWYGRAWKWFKRVYLGTN